MKTVIRENVVVVLVLTVPEAQLLRDIATVATETLEDDDPHKVLGEELLEDLKVL